MMHWISFDIIRCWGSSTVLILFTFALPTPIIWIFIIFLIFMIFVSRAVFLVAICTMLSGHVICIVFNIILFLFRHVTWKNWSWGQRCWCILAHWYVPLIICWYLRTGEWSRGWSHNTFISSLRTNCFTPNFKILYLKLISLFNCYLINLETCNIVSRIYECIIDRYLVFLTSNLKIMKRSHKRCKTSNHQHYFRNLKT